MHEDADALGVLRPDHEPRATEFVEPMQKLIGNLVHNGLAYKAGIPAAVAFAAALALTLALVAWRPHDPAIARSTICLILAIAMTGLGECLDAIAVPSTFAFLWLGIALRQCRVGDRPLVPGAAR